MHLSAVALAKADRRPHTTDAGLLSPRNIHRGKQLPVEEVAHSISRNFGVVFNSQILWLETLDALLRPIEGVPIKVPAELRKLHKEEETFWA